MSVGNHALSSWPHGLVTGCCVPILLFCVYIYRQTCLHVQDQMTPTQLHVLKNEMLWAKAGAQQLSPKIELFPGLN